MAFGDSSYTKAPIGLGSSQTRETMKKARDNKAHIATHARVQLQRS